MNRRTRRILQAVKLLESQTLDEITDSFNLTKAELAQIDIFIKKKDL